MERTKRVRMMTSRSLLTASIKAPTMVLRPGKEEELMVDEEE